MEENTDFIAGALVIVWFVGAMAGSALVLRKVNRPTWRALIPGLNACEICWATGISAWWLLLIFVPLANFGVCLYIGLRLAERFGASDLIGLLIGGSGFGLLPLLGLSRFEPQPESVATSIESHSTTDDAGVSPAAGARYATTASARDPNRAARVGMLVLTCVYGLCLLCVPGAIVVGAMAFDGVNQVTRAMEVIVLIAAMFPLSLLAALFGGWICYLRNQYRLAYGLSALPVVNFLLFVLALLVAL